MTASTGYRFFRTDDGNRVYVDAEGTCTGQRCGVGRLFHEHADIAGSIYAVRCPASLTMQLRAKLQRPNGRAITQDATPPEVPEVDRHNSAERLEDGFQILGGE